MKARLLSIVTYGETLKPITVIGMISAISIVIKLAYIQLLRGGLGTLPPESDVYFYNGAARVLLQYGVYGLSPNSPTVEMPPGQPVFLAILYKIGGDSIAFAQIAHVLMLTFVVVLTYLTARIIFSQAVAFWSGILIAIDPAQTFLSGSFLSEALFIFSMCTAIFLLVLERERTGNWWRPLLAAIFFAVAGLTRNQGWPFPAVILVGALVTRGRLLSVKTSLIVFLATYLLVIPWSIRNYRLVNTFVPVSTGGGLNLWAGNNPEFDWRAPMPMSLPIYERPEGLSFIEVNDFYQQKATNWIKDNFYVFIRNGFRKVVVLYHFDPMTHQDSKAWLFRIIGIFPYGMLLPFILLGIKKQIYNSRIWLILLYILYITLLAAIFFSDTRMRTPIQPYLYMIAVTWLVDFILKRFGSVTEFSILQSSSVHQI